MKCVQLPSLLLSLFLGLASFGCERPELADTSQPLSETHDSADIRIVQNARPPEGSRLAWRIVPEPAVSIGVVEGEEPYMLHRALDATRLPDGRIVVANGGTAEVRVFDALGTHLVTFGGSGEGPGEFRALWQVAPWPGDSIMARDLATGRVSIFESNGNHGRSYTLELREGPVRLSDPVAVRRDGSMLVLQGGIRGPAVVEIRDGEGQLSVSLGEHPDWETIIARSSGGYTEPIPVAYSRELVTSLWGALVVVGPNDRYEIKAFRADGTLSRIVRREHEPRVPTEADQQVFVERRMAQYRGSSDQSGAPPPAAMLAMLQETMESIPLAATFPAYSTILTDDAGHLWVREYDFPQEERPAPLWTVFDPEGHVLGFIETPGDIRIHHIGTDYILGHTRDELGVEYVQVWTLER